MEKEECEEEIKPEEKRLSITGMFVSFILNPSYSLLLFLIILAIILAITTYKLREKS
jgi:hypothetical protein